MVDTGKIQVLFQPIEFSFAKFDRLDRVSLEENEKRSQHSRKKRKEGGFSFGPLKLVKDIFRNYGSYGLARRNGNSELNFKILLKTPS